MLSSKGEQFNVQSLDNGTSHQTATPYPVEQLHSGRKEDVKNEIGKEAAAVDTHQRWTPGNCAHLFPDSGNEDFITSHSKLIDLKKERFKD